MREAVEECGGHLRVASEHARPLAEGEVRGYHDGGLLIEAADQVEQELPAGLGEGQIAELVQHDEVHAREVIGDAALASGAALCLESVDEVDDVEEASAGAVADAGARDRDREVGSFSANLPFQMSSRRASIVNACRRARA